MTDSITTNHHPDPDPTDPRPLTFADLMRIDRLSSPAVHPDGSSVAYVVTTHDHRKNQVRSTIMLQDLDPTSAEPRGEPRPITPGHGSHSDPAWSPDGTQLAFVSDRDDEKDQLWVLPFAAGGEAEQLTTGRGGASKPVWSPDGTRIAFARRVVVSPHWRTNAAGEGASDNESDADDDDLDAEQRIHARTYGLVNPRSAAIIEDRLLYRHWDRWRKRERSHIFVLDLETRHCRDLMPDLDTDAPPISLGGELDYQFSPDGSELAFVMNPDDEVALSTNNSVYVQPLDGCAPLGPPIRISDTDAMDLDVRYSPDGRLIAYLGAEKPTYEADRLRVKLYDRATGETRVVTDALDRSAAEPVWTADSTRIYFTAADRGYRSVYGVDVDVGDGTVKQYTTNEFLHAPRAIGEAHDRLLVLTERATQPAQLAVLTLGDGFEPCTAPGPITSPAKAEPPPRRNWSIATVTDHNRWLVTENIDLAPLEEFWYEGADDDPVHGFLIKPPGFDPTRKYPVLLIIHGGPQSAFFNHFHYRWNPHLFVSDGCDDHARSAGSKDENNDDDDDKNDDHDGGGPYRQFVGIQLNPRGSIGYGQQFTDQISGDWGGRCYKDIIKGLDHCLATYPFLDADHIAAAGASFGGFMINWIAGHPGRYDFRALVSHDGIFNQETMSYMTEELWFDYWEHGGFPHEDHGSFLRFSPHMHVQHFRTPMLVIQGEQDFRCPVSEGISLFTALQVMGVPSRLLYFPNEGHWVLKPANLEVWYHTIRQFVAEHIGGT